LLGLHQTPTFKFWWVCPSICRSQKDTFINQNV
jgi:hypothetical protein